MFQEHGVYVEFFMHPVEQKFKSVKEGRPVFQDVPHIRLVTPGDRNNAPVFIATDEHKNKYRQAWKAFENNDHRQMIGTPVHMLPGISKSQAVEAEHFNVHTIEQLAEISDSTIMSMGIGFRDLRNRAKAYISASKDRARENELQEKNAALQSQIDELKAQMAEREPRKPGPKPKETTE